MGGEPSRGKSRGACGGTTRGSSGRPPGGARAELLVDLAFLDERGRGDVRHGGVLVVGHRPFHYQVLAFSIEGVHEPQHQQAVFDRAEEVGQAHSGLGHGVHEAFDDFGAHLCHARMRRGLARDGDPFAGHGCQLM